VGILGVIGGVLVLMGFALLVLVDAPRRALAQLAVLGPVARRRVQTLKHNDGARAALGMDVRHVMHDGMRFAKQTGRWFLGR
jgi:hypothetical protein